MTKHTRCFSCGVSSCDRPAVHFVRRRFRPPRRLHTCYSGINRDYFRLSPGQSSDSKRAAWRFSLQERLSVSAAESLFTLVCSNAAHAGGQTCRQFPILAVPLNQCGRLSESQTGIPPETHGMTKTWENKGTKNPKCLVQ